MTLNRALLIRMKYRFICVYLHASRFKSAEPPNALARPSAVLKFLMYRTQLKTTINTLPYGFS